MKTLKNQIRYQNFSQIYLYIRVIVDGKTYTHINRKIWYQVWDQSGLIISPIENQIWITCKED